MPPKRRRKAPRRGRAKRNTHASISQKQIVNVHGGSGGGGGGGSGGGGFVPMYTPQPIYTQQPDDAFKTTLLALLKKERETVPVPVPAPTSAPPALILRRKSEQPETPSPLRDDDTSVSSVVGGGSVRKIRVPRATNYGYNQERIPYLTKPPPGTTIYNQDGTVRRKPGPTPGVTSPYTFKLRTKKS